MKYAFENAGQPSEAEFSEANVRDIFLPLLRRLAELQQRKGGRVLALLAAPPGAGKSTLASFLRHLSLTEAGLRPLTVIAMDGFHRYRDDLARHTAVHKGETVSLLKIKGAPETFDLEKLRHALDRVAAGEDCGWPAYDRRLHNPVPDAVEVKGDLVLMEGNYLLLDEPGWRDLRDAADYTIAITADPDRLRARLLRRHIAVGKSAEEAIRFVEFSDMDNVRLCLERSLPADLRLRLLADDTFEAV